MASVLEKVLRVGEGRTLHLRGTVDRIDRTAEGTIVVTDHKSGAGKRYRDLGPDNPTLDATVFQDPEGQGGGGVWGCYLALDGVKLPKDILIPFKLVNKDNVDDFLAIASLLDKLGQLVLGFSDAMHAHKREIAIGWPFRQGVPFPSHP